MVPYSVSKRRPTGAQFNGVPILSESKLRSAVHKVRAKIAEDTLDLESTVSEKFVKTERIRDTFRRPEDQSDRLYQPGYEHTGSCDCLLDESLAPTALVTRPERKQYDRIKIHCGPIGSADSVVKDPIERDELARKFELLCFETESAGLMAGFPCLPIRGICDYSDTHKNKKWQGYAAAVAATFALSLLRTVPYEDLQATGNNINGEALRQHIDLVVQTVMRITSRPLDGNTLTLEDAGQAMEEIRDTVKMLEELSKDLSETKSTLGENAAAIEATKNRLNEIETGQKGMQKLLDELREKIAKQHEKCAQEERKEWETLDDQVQRESTSLKKTTESTTAALQSTAGMLNNIGTLANNQKLAGVGNRLGVASRLAQRIFPGASRFGNTCGKGRESPSPNVGRGTSSAVTRPSTNRPAQYPRRLPPPLLPVPQAPVIGLSSIHESTSDGLPRTAAVDNMTNATCTNRKSSNPPPTTTAESRQFVAGEHSPTRYGARAPTTST
jgi:archaellum component FlaC